MKETWIISEVKKADKSKGFLILEDPERKQYLDDILINKIFQQIIN